uniref:Rad21_Rec8_N domain-containing protein n=1 Tax=Panagrellus redivivus TaxID=6233 RepID=A0A7E4W964_PANRE
MFDLPLCLKKRGGPFAIVWTFGTDKKALQRFSEEDVLKVDLKNITVRIIECIPVFARSQHNVFKPETMLSLAAIAKMILGCCRIHLYHNNKIVLTAERCLQNLEDPREIMISPFDSEVEDFRNMSPDEAVTDMEPIPQPDMDDFFDEMEGAPPSPRVDAAVDDADVVPGKKDRAKKNPKRTCRNRGRSVDSDDELGQPKRKKRAPRKPKLSAIPEEPLNDNTTAVDNITTAGVPTIAPLIEDVENMVYEDGGDLEALDVDELENFNDLDFVSNLPLAADVNAAVINQPEETSVIMMQADETVIAGNAATDEPMDLDAPYDPDAGAPHFDEQFAVQTDPEREVVMMGKKSPERVATFLPQGQTDAENVVFHQFPDNTATFIESRFDATDEIEMARRRIRASSAASITGDFTNVVSEPNKTGNVTSHLDEVPQLDYMSQRSASSEPENREQLLAMRNSVPADDASVIVEMDDRNDITFADQTDADQSMFIAYETNTPRKRRVLKPRTKKDPRAAKVDRDKRCWAKIRKNACQRIEELRIRDANRDYEEEIEMEEGFGLLDASRSQSRRLTASPHFDVIVQEPVEAMDDLQPLDDAELFIEPAAELPQDEEIQPLGEAFDERTVENPPVDEPSAFQPLSPMSSRYSSPAPVPSRAASPVQNPASQDLFTSQMSESEDSDVGLLPGATYFLADHLKDIPTEFKFAEIDIDDEPSVINFSDDQIYEVLLSHSYAKKKILFNFKELFGRFDVHLKAFMFQALTLLAGKERLIMLPCDQDDDLQFCLAPDAHYLKGMKKLIAHVQKTGWTPAVEN